MKNTITYLQLNNQLKKMIGKPLWATLVGGCTGSILGLRFGKKLKKARPTPNPHLSRIVRYYNGEFSMMIFCAWRVERDSKIICGTGDCNERGELTVEGIRILHGKRVRSVHVGKIPDLCIDFDAGYKLRLFCDTKTSNKKSYHKWYFVIMKLEKIVYSANENGKVYQEAL
jgi:hypothetical protein